MAINKQETEMSDGDKCFTEKTQDLRRIKIFQDSILHWVITACKSNQGRYVGMGEIGGGD